MINVKTVNDYKGYGQCTVIDNGIVEAYVTNDVGPRLIRYAFIGGCNVLNDDLSLFPASTDEEFEKKFGKAKAWQNFGGHRFWIAPEKYPDTYYPDCEKVSVKPLLSGAVFTPKAQTENGRALELTVTMDCDGSLTLTHRVTNISGECMRIAPWAISVSALGGVEIIPLNTENTGLLPNNSIAVWPYTDLRDERIYIGKKYVTVCQKNIDSNLKLGFNSTSGKVYYNVNDTVYSVNYTSEHGTADYVDFGVSLETYSCKDFTEVETLGKLCNLKPGESTEHTEHWSIYKTAKTFDPKNDDSIDAFIKSL